jgi:hypothetical protein
VKISLVILWTLWFSFSLPSSISISKENSSEEYVYLLKSEGGKVYRRIEQPTEDKKETVRKEIRRMELLSPGTIMEIEKGASIYLTCGGCRILNLTYKDSPYVVKMKDFKKEGPSTSEMMNQFIASLKYFVYPDSKPVSKVQLQTRGLQKKGLCKYLWPPDIADIMPIEPITFKWEAKGTHFSLEIKEFGNSATVYSEKTMLKKIDVPLGIFKPGRRYEWFLLDEEKGEKCRATFTLLSKNDSNRIMEIVDNIPKLLPPGIDMETRCRLQAGYFISEGLTYDAWRWLDRNGISQPFQKDEEDH